MSRFLEHAAEIFEAAAAGPSGTSAALTILIRPEGQIHIVDGLESPVEALQAQHGCRTAFRVLRDRCGVRVEGRNGAVRCTLEDSGRAKPAGRPAFLFDCPVYVLGPSEVAPRELAA